MNNIQKVIEKAIEGGYLFHGDKLTFDDSMGDWFVSDGDGGYIVPSTSEFFIDPLFWQALGKSLGWKKVEKHIDSGSPKYNIYFVDGWVERWHNFIDHLASGKSAEDFFGELLGIKNDE